ncbi:hypothetical protein DCAR_0104434 [Daucus carota subsp. sativus]|uniref:Uncharacterized protein n=1 Tax=Daucus carota subsp. sativus TaxID=79200 RepID=A0A166IUB3_DAUCS|nr:hypothetical protein DCAR_0104434 [Daucus carota subsp. sativus]
MYLLLLAITIGCASSARILEEAEFPVNQQAAYDPPEIDDLEEAPVAGALLNCQVGRYQS